VKVLRQNEGRGWVAYNADCVDVVSSMPESSIGFSVYSPPFASLYTYSASVRDMGNVKTHAEFHQHYGYLLGELLRVTKPGRNMSIHCMDIPSSKSRDGEIGLIDFPGQIIAACQAAGWIWHSKVTIWKDPVTAMQRTKALGLLHKTIRKDSCMSRMGIPDYVLTFRKPGTNPDPVTHTPEEFPVSMWQKWASPVWTSEDFGEDVARAVARDCWGYWPDINPSDTLQHRSARENEDERHICPLQLEVIRRCIRMWSNPGDVVLSPFGGIGSEGYVAMQEGRRSVTVELKGSYYEQAIKNLASVEPGAKGQQTSLFGA